MSEDKYTEIILDTLIMEPDDDDSSLELAGKIAYTIISPPIVGVGALTGHLIDEVVEHPVTQLGLAIGRGFARTENIDDYIHQFGDLQGVSPQDTPDFTDEDHRDQLTLPPEPDEGGASSIDPNIYDQNSIICDPDASQFDGGTGGDNYTDEQVDNDQAYTPGEGYFSDGTDIGG